MKSMQKTIWHTFTKLIPQFRLKSLLLLTFVMATISDGFLRPKVVQRKLGHSLITESSLVREEKTLPNTGQKVQWLESGGWRLLDRGGSVLAKGHLDRGQATGWWRYFRDDGSVLAEGECIHDQMFGEWTYLSTEGEAISKVQIGAAPAVVAPIPKNSPHDPLHDHPEQQARWKSLLEQGTFEQRSLAIREMRLQGIRALPILLSIVENKTSPSRADALEAIALLGEEAQSAAPQLRQLASSPSEFLCADLIDAMLIIDPQHRSDHIAFLFDRFAQQPTNPIAIKPTRVMDLLTRTSFQLSSDLASYTNDKRVTVRRLVAYLLTSGLYIRSYARPEYDDLMTLDPMWREIAHGLNWVSAKPSEYSRMRRLLDAMGSDADEQICLLANLKPSPHTAITPWNRRDKNALLFFSEE